MKERDDDDVSIFSDREDDDVSIFSDREDDDVSDSEDEPHHPKLHQSKLYSIESFVVTVKKDCIEVYRGGENPVYTDMKALERFIQYPASDDLLKRTNEFAEHLETSGWYDIYKTFGCVVASHAGVDAHEFLTHGDTLDVLKKQAAQLVTDSKVADGKVTDFTVVDRSEISDLVQKFQRYLERNRWTDIRVFNGYITGTDTGNGCINAQDAGTEYRTIDKMHHTIRTRGLSFLEFKKQVDGLFVTSIRSDSAAFMSRLYRAQTRIQPWSSERVDWFEKTDPVNGDHVYVLLRNGIHIYFTFIHAQQVLFKVVDSSHDVTTEDLVNNGIRGTISRFENYMYSRYINDVATMYTHMLKTINDVTQKYDCKVEEYADFGVSILNATRRVNFQVNVFGKVKVSGGRTHEYSTFTKADVEEILQFCKVPLLGSNFGIGYINRETGSHTMQSDLVGTLHEIHERLCRLNGVVDPSDDGYAKPPSLVNRHHTDEADRDRAMIKHLIGVFLRQVCVQNGSPNPSDEPAMAILKMLRGNQYAERPIFAVLHYIKPEVWARGVYKSENIELIEQTVSNMKKMLIKAHGRLFDASGSSSAAFNDDPDSIAYRSVD